MDPEEKIKKAETILPSLLKSLEHCDLCHHKCGINRIKGEKGRCLAPSDLLVYSYQAHKGEEPPLSGREGSGTIFFSHCSLNCVYCQNWQFSQKNKGTKITPRELCEIMLKLQDKGCHNINLVSPTHFTPGIVEAIKQACMKGLALPIVYNTGGYDSLENIKGLGGIVDIYLPDMRYSSDLMAEKYSQAVFYTENNRLIIREMHRQAGILQLSSDGIAIKGLLIRLLMLPGGISGTEDSLEFIASEIGCDTYLSIMSQYYPACKANHFEELSHRITSKDYYSVIKKMRELNLNNGWVQPVTDAFDKEFSGENFSPF